MKTILGSPKNLSVISSFIKKKKKTPLSVENIVII